jgi:hypothetical protein
LDVVAKKDDVEPWLEDNSGDMTLVIAVVNDPAVVDVLDEERRGVEAGEINVESLFCLSCKETGVSWLDEELGDWGKGRWCLLSPKSTGHSE